MTDEPGPDALPVERVRDLDARALERRLAGSLVGHAVELHRALSSSNDVALARAAEGAPEGLVVLADEQLAGRGRHGRTWSTPPGVAIAMSVLLRPELPARRVPQVPMAVALAALDALEPRAPKGVTVALKWPNDVTARTATGNERKLAGLLAETAWRQGETPAVVVGLGINVRQATDGALPPGATSLAALGADEDALDRTALLADLLHALDERYTALRAGQDLVAPWSARLATIGREVVARPGPVRGGGEGGDGRGEGRPAGEGGGDSGGPHRGASSGRADRGARDARSDDGTPPAVRGTAVGVTPDGALRVATAAGEVELRAGDVTLAR